MNSLTDLRQTLDRHADDVAAAGLAGDAAVRSAQVHRRVAVVRRRRRAAGGVALALALVAGGSAALVSRDHHRVEPASPVVLGVRAPETITSLGYTYRSDGRAETFAGHGSVKVAASSTPTLYSWTADRPGQVRLVLPDGETWTSQQTRFSDFVQIPAGTSGTLKVSVPHGSVGLASYALTDTAPAGYTKDGTTFRQEVAGAPLLGAVISDLGQISAHTRFTNPPGEVGVRLSCSGLPKGDVVHVSFEGHDRVAGTCQGSSAFDPGAASGSSFRLHRAGRDVRVRVWATTGVKSLTPLPAGSAPKLRLRVGVYGPLAFRPVGGYRVPELVEYDGHTWRVRGTSSSPTGAPVSIGPASWQAVAAMAWNTHGRTTVRFTASGTTPAGTSTNGGQASMGDLWVPQGATVHASLTRGTGSVGVALYRRVD